MLFLHKLSIEMKLRIALYSILLICCNFPSAAMDSSLLVKSKTHTVDICIYGGTAAGVIAAYTAKKMGKTVLLIEPGRHLGGMSSGGLGYTDIGNKYVVTGLSRDFYRRIGAHYGKFEQWIFEPKVAEAIFNDYVKRAGINVLFENRLIQVKKEGKQIKEITLEHAYNPAAATNQTIDAKVFIDCTYEGDLMARAGVSYTVGREANSQYNETLNGVQLMTGHQFPDDIDPYVVPGDEKSGLLWGINNQPLQANGTGDKKVQAYNFRLTLTNVPANRIAVSRPENYDPKKYELLKRLKEKLPWKSHKDVFIWSLMPNGKTDINNKGGFSTDMIGMNWDYPEGDYDTRNKILKQHEEYTKGLLYFVGNDPGIPENIRSEMRQWGYPKDEFTDNGNFTPQMYIREARRMVGELVMTQHHCQGREVVKDGVGMAAYQMDSHNCDRQVVNGMVKNEGNVEVSGFGPYPVSYRAIVPKQEEVVNLIVPVCLSASHIAYGSIRMEPVFMVLSQSAAVAAAMAIDTKKPVQQIDVMKLQRVLKTNPLADNSVAEILIDNEDAAQVTVNGSWRKRNQGSYGPSMLVDSSHSISAKSVRFTPLILKEGKYNIYVYFPKLPGATSKTNITVFDGKSKKESVIKEADVRVQGQTTGEWVALGTYAFAKGRKGYVEVSNKSADGIVIADAVLLVPETGAK